MRNLTIADVLLGLQDMRTSRLAKLRSFEAGKVYEPTIIGAHSLDVGRFRCSNPLFCSETMELYS